MEEMNAVQAGIDNELDKVKTPKLSLDAEGTIDTPFSGFSMAAMSMSQESNVETGAINESMLSEEERKQIDEFYKQIDVTDVKMLNSYGSVAQKGISSFSSSIMNYVKPREFGEVGDSLRELRTTISSTVTLERKGVLGVFQKGKTKVTYLISNFESAETNIRKIEQDLQKHQQTLTKDVFVFDQMYNMNLEYYKDLTMYIIAGKKALELARNGKLAELRTKAELTQDRLDIQLYRDYADACVRFEKRIFDLETTRMVSIQMAPQIRLLQQADQEIVDKLRSNVINTIPLWRNQMLLALGIEHSRRALNAQSAVTEMTNEMFRINAETLRQGAIDAATAAERAVVDIETLKVVNQEIIKSINEVVRIHEEGSKRRMDAQSELAKIEDELKMALLKAGSR